jgi:hypothetical protein
MVPLVLLAEVDPEIASPMPIIPPLANIVAKLTLGPIIGSQVMMLLPFPLKNLKRKLQMLLVELTNLKTTSTTLLPGAAIKNQELKEVAHSLKLFQTFTKGIIQITRIN